MSKNKLEDARSVSVSLASKFLSQSCQRERGWTRQAYHKNGRKMQGNAKNANVMMSSSSSIIFSSFPFLDSIAWHWIIYSSRTKWTKLRLVSFYSRSQEYLEAILPKIKLNVNIPRLFCKGPRQFNCYKDKVYTSRFIVKEKPAKLALIK